MPVNRTTKISGPVEMSPVANAGSEQVNPKEHLIPSVNCVPLNGGLWGVMCGTNESHYQVPTRWWCSDDPPAKKKEFEKKYLAILRRPVKPGEEDYPEIEKKVRAIWVFGSMGKDGAVAIPYLMAFLKSPDERLRRAAVTALGNLGVQEALPQILTLAKEDPVPYMKAVALEAVLLLTKKSSL